MSSIFHLYFKVPVVIIKGLINIVLYTALLITDIIISSSTSFTLVDIRSLAFQFERLTYIEHFCSRGKRTQLTPKSHYEFPKYIYKEIL